MSTIKIYGILAALLILAISGNAQMRIIDSSEVKLNRTPDKYSIIRDTEITVNLELINSRNGEGIPNQRVNVTFDKPASVVNPSGLLQEGDKYYKTTDADGKFSFKVKPRDTVAIYFDYPGTDTIKGSKGRMWINILWAKSELLSADFVILMLILVVAVFSYRFFKQRRTEIESWIQDLRGEG